MRTDGPDAIDRATMITADPFAAAKFFDFTIALVCYKLLTTDQGMNRFRRMLVDKDAQFSFDVVQVLVIVFAMLDDEDITTIYA